MSRRVKAEVVCWSYTLGLAVSAILTVKGWS